MNITVSTAAFLKKLKLVAKIVNAKTLQPILANVHLSAADGTVTLYTSNYDLAMTAMCEATVHTPGAITVPVQALVSALSSSKPETFTLGILKNRVQIQAGALTLRLNAMPAEDFPPMRPIPEGGVLLPSAAFHDALRRVRSAISETERRHLIQGALLSMTANKIALVTTDGHRLAISVAPREMPGELRDVLIPVKAIDLLLADTDSDDLLFVTSDRAMFFVSEQCVIMSSLIEGTFPQYQRIIPRDNNRHFIVERHPLLQALKRVSLTADDERGITFTVNTNQLVLTAKNHTLGDATESLHVVYDGPELTFTVEWNFVADFLTAARSETVLCWMKDAAANPQLNASTWIDQSIEFMTVIMHRSA